MGTEAQKVYNPFDILLFISNNKMYKNYWFETGTTTFLIKLLQKNKYYIPSLENLTIPEDYLSFFDVENLTVEILLLQAGYLTIERVETRMNDLRYCTLNYPNFEVKQSLNGSVLQRLFGNIQPLTISNNFNLTFDLLNKNNIAELETVLRSLFAGVSNDWYRNNNIADYEGYYCSVVYTFFNAMGLTVIGEDNTNVGRVDLSIITDDKVILLEFKMLEHGDAKSALQQIKNKKYHEKYLALRRNIYMVGVSFDKSVRNVHDFVCESL